MNDQIGTTALLTFLRIDKQRLRVWLQRGVFGPDRQKIGSGYRHRFTFDEALYARAIKELMDLISVRSLEGLVEGRGKLLEEIRDSFNSPFRKMRAGSHGKLLPFTWWLCLAWMGSEYLVQSQFNSLDPERIKTKLGRAAAFIVIPMHELEEDTRVYFRKLGLEP